MDLVPFPKHITMNEGMFFLNKDIQIVLDLDRDLSDLNMAFLLKDELRRITTFGIHITRSNKSPRNQVISLCKGLLKRQCYELTVNRDNIVIAAGDSEGMFYGVQTLRQIIRTAGPEIPCLSIYDEPDFMYRGYFHDITRGKIPTLDTLKELADRAAFYKINQLQLYIEHCFKFQNTSEIWTANGSINAEEIMIFDEYCKKQHIELVPSLATFGHLFNLLSSRTYKHLCEIDVDPDKPYSWLDRCLHHTIDVSNPESISLVQEMLDEFIPLFSSDKFNINCDETLDIGEGKNKRIAAKLGKGRLYIDFLNKVITHVKKHNKTVMFWGDFILRYPEYLNEIPEDVVCLNWDYSSEVGEEKVKAIADAGVKQYVCPGVSGWDRLMNDMDLSYTNIEKMILYGKQNGAIGVLNTDWGDCGHVNLFANSIPGLIFGADMSWNTKGARDFSEIDKKVSRLEFGDATGTLVGLLRELGRQPVRIWTCIDLWAEEKFYRNKLDLGIWDFPAKEMIINCSTELIVEKNKKALDIERELIKLYSGMTNKHEIDFQEFLISARGTALFHSLLLIIKKVDFKQDIDCLLNGSDELAILLEYWFDEFSEVWRRRNKESELYRIKDMIIKICAYLRDLNGVK